MSIRQQSFAATMHPSPLSPPETPIRSRPRPNPIYNIPVTLESNIKHFLRPADEDQEEPTDSLTQVLPSYQPRKPRDPQQTAQKIRHAARKLKTADEPAIRSLARYYLILDHAKVAEDKPAQYFQDRIVDVENKVQRRKGTAQTLRDMRTRRSSADQKEDVRTEKLKCGANLERAASTAEKAIRSDSPAELEGFKIRWK